MKRVTLNTAGKFIVFEGGEGSGKSHHTALLARFFEQRGDSVIQTYEPGATLIGSALRKILLDYRDDGNTPLAVSTELFLFLADRAQHVTEIIQPALARGEIVICDRFVGSTLAYQGGGRTIADRGLLLTMNDFATKALIPNIVFYLDVDPRIGLARKQKQDGGNLNRLDRENLEFHDRVRASFRQLAQKNKNWVTLEAGQSIEKVEEDILSIINSHEYFR